MTLLLILLAGGLVAALVALLLVVRELRRRSNASLRGMTVVVTTHPDDRTYRGVVMAEHADRVTLRDAFLVTPAGEQAIGGLQHLYRSSFTGAQQIEA